MAEPRCVLAFSFCAHKSPSDLLMVTREQSTLWMMADNKIVPMCHSRRALMDFFYHHDLALGVISQNNRTMAVSVSSQLFSVRLNSLPSFR